MRRLAKGRNGIRRDTDAKVEAELVRILTCVEEERSASEVRRQIRRRRLRDRHAREQRGREEIQGKCRQVRLRAGDGDAVQERRVVPTAEPSNDQVLAVHDRGPDDPLHCIGRRGIRRLRHLLAGDGVHHDRRPLAPFHLHGCLRAIRFGLDDDLDDRVLVADERDVDVLRRSCLDLDVGNPLRLVELVEDTQLPSPRR